MTPSPPVPLTPRRPRGPHTRVLSERQRAGADDPDLLEQCRLGPPDAQGRFPVGLGLSGLHCAACALTIEQALLAVPGVAAAQVQSASQRARVTLESDSVPLSALMTAVQSVGYQAWPDAGARHVQARQAGQRRLLWRLLVAWLCMMQVMMISTGQYVAGRHEVPPDLWNLLNWAAWVLTLPVLVFSCGPFFSGAWRGLRQRRIAMDLPVALGMAAMFTVSTAVTFGHTPGFGQEVYFDSLTMFVAFLLTGRWLEGRARDRVTHSLESLSARLPEAVERAVEGLEVPLSRVQVDTVPLSRLRPGDRVRVAVGQAFPADGVLLEGRTEVDESMLTGESRPVPRRPGQRIVAGSLNLASPVWVQAERLGPDTRHQQIVSLVHQALTEKPGWMRAADRFSGPFLAAVLLASALGGLAWLWIDPSRALWVAVSVLVVTCPCALSLSAPSALLAAASHLARSGVLVRRLDALEVLARAGVVLFDKTGTLTQAQMGVTTVRAALGREHDWQRAASLAAHSQHPVAQALARHGVVGSERGPGPTWTQVQEHAGQGLSALDAAGLAWRLGSALWVLGPERASELSPTEAQARVWLAPVPVTGEAPDPAQASAFLLDEQLRPGASEALRRLQALGLEVALLSGDHQARVHQAVQGLGGTPPISVLAFEASPEQKLAALVELQRHGCAVAVVGDGINDAPMLARADVSFVMDQGAALAQAQADFLVLGGKVGGVAEAVHASRWAMHLVRQNLLWSASYNALCIPLALMGWMPPWAAGIGMALSSCVVVLNALRPSPRTTSEASLPPTPLASAP